MDFKKGNLYPSDNLILEILQESISVHVTQK